MTAGDLADGYAVSKPTMSTHFAALKEAGLIEGRKNGVVIHYYLNATVAEEAMASLIDLLGSAEAVLTTRSSPTTDPLKLEPKT